MAPYKPLYVDVLDDLTGTGGYVRIRFGSSHVEPKTTDLLPKQIRSKKALNRQRKQARSKRFVPTF